MTRSTKYGIIFCEQISWITRSTKWVRLAKCTWSCLSYQRHILSILRGVTFLQHSGTHMLSKLNLTLRPIYLYQATLVPEIVQEKPFYNICAHFVSPLNLFYHHSTSDQAIWMRTKGVKNDHHHLNEVVGTSEEGI